MAERTGANACFPADLMFSAGRGNAANQDPHIPTLIVRVNRTTLLRSVFYEDAASMGLYAVSWSPDGAYLAIFRFEGDRRLVEDGILRICLLTRAGELHTCFAETVAALNREAIPLVVTWSTDSSRIYFLMDADDQRHLVEGDVQTGKIIRILFTYEKAGRGFYNIVWSPALDFLIYNTGNFFDDVEHIDLVTGTTRSLSDLFPSREAYLCPQVSPANNLVVGMYRPEASSTDFIFLDSTGSVVQELPLAKVELDLFSCPMWSSDDTFFYFLGYSGENMREEVLYRYTRATRELVEIPTPHNTIPQALLSPDGRFLVFPSEDGDYLSVMSPDGKIRTFGTEYLFATNPLWMPVMGS